MRAKWKKAKRRHHKSRRAHHKALASVPTNSLYEPLPSKSSIRLITLHPGDFNDSIRCTLEVFELASVPSYEAISYVWGDPTPRNRIRCNGRRYLIGDNLNDTIRRVRSKDEPRVIWVDALCIDQVNLGERSHQVLLMRDVYSRTRRTLICLDIKPSIDPDEVHWTAIAYQAILKIVDWSERNSFPLAYSGSKYGISAFLPLEAQHWVALNRLFSCKWFRRVWVIQEAVLSPESIFIVDQQKWRWYPLGIACARLGEYFDELPQFYSLQGLAQLYSIWILITRKEDNIVPSLLVNMDIFTFALATDPRDLIYGLLAISKEQSLLEQQMRSGLPGFIPLPNYEDSFRDVFTDWARYFIESSGRLTIFSLTLVIGDGSQHGLDFVPHEKNGKPNAATWTTEDASFPSWVPHWDITWGVDLYRSTYRQGEPLGYRSSGVLPLKLKPLSRRDIITPSGVMFDNVRWTGHVMYQTSFHPRIQDDVVMNNFLSIKSKLDSYPTGDTVQNAYAIVAAAGHMPQKPLENTSSHGDNMMAYFAWLTSALKETPDSMRTLDYMKYNAEWNAAYVRIVHDNCRSRRFFITEKGYLGLGPGPMEVGDQVCVLFGGDTPFILRKVEDHFRLIGESYIYGIMEGEVIQLWEAGELEEQWFEIR